MRRLVPVLTALALVLAAPGAWAQQFRVVPCPACPSGYAAVPFNGGWGGNFQFGGNFGSGGFTTLPYYGGGQFGGSPFPSGGTPLVGEAVSGGASPYASSSTYGYGGSSPYGAGSSPVQYGGNGGGGCNGHGGGQQWLAGTPIICLPPGFVQQAQQFPRIDLDHSTRLRFR